MNRSLALFGLALAAPCVALASPLASDASEPVMGLVAPDGGQLLLTHTDVHASVQLGVAVVDIQQTFLNPYEEVVDATYIFPLPVEAAVRSMQITCGERVIEAKVADRESARQQYAQAQAQGKRAALLEQQRPNLFTQRVSSLCPGETVRVALQYVEQVTRLDGRDTLVFPTTTGQRFEPADLAEPDLVAAAHTPHRLSWSVSLLDGLPLESVFSDTHAVSVTDEGDWGAEITFASVAEIPDSDVHLAWTTAGSSTRASVVVAEPLPDEDRAYVAVTLEPALLEDLPPPRKRELFFVMDSSCSMSGQPWNTSVAAVRAALDGMTEDDTFNLVKFSSGSESLFDAPAPATAANVRLAKGWLGSFQGGGTRMDAGLIHALTQAGDPDALRLVLMTTDGYIGDERGLFQVVDGHRAENTRVFGLGVGSSVNRMLLDGLADVGRGAVQYQLPDTPIEETVDRFHDRIARPAMTDLSIDWGDLVVQDQYPRELPDLWAGQPVRVVARVANPVDTTITLSGQVGGEWYDLHRPLDATQADAHEGVRALWARRRIAWLERPLATDVGARQDEIRDTALRHHLVSSQTSLIAVDDDPSPCGRATRDLDVPLVAPAGTAGGRGGIPSVGGVGGLIGTKGTQFGSGGLGGRGSGLGGGGTAEGLGGLGSTGVGSGRGYGTRSGDFGAKAEGGISTVSAAPIIMGALDRSNIDEVIKRHMNAIRYCYQRQLTKDPALGGKVVVKFTIAADGTVAVAAIKSTTMNNDSVEDCVVGRFQRMQFAPPVGGGIVIVSYPFLFSPG